VIPVATRAYRVRVACGYCAVFKGRREGKYRPHGSVAGRRAPVSQNSTACAGSGEAVCLAGPARFGRRARPYGRWPAFPPLPLRAAGSRRRRAVRAPC